MKKLVSRTLVLAVVLGFSLTTLASGEEGSWSGWVTDSHCGVSAKSASASHKDCAIKCVKEKGAKWALYNPSDSSLFNLSGDDAMMVKMAATEVTVKGSMDKEKKTITVTSMEAAPAKAPAK